jgi:hypothetical protein
MAVQPAALVPCGHIRQVMRCLDRKLLEDVHLSLGQIRSKY